LTIFPGIFESPLKESILRRAIENKLLEVNIIDIRRFALDKHRTIDDAPYGGGPGMVMKVEPILRAYESVENKGLTILLTPQGERFTHNIAKILAEKEQLTFICGHYEGIDERINKLIVDMELSIGDYITTGGELPCLVVIDAITRLIPGVVGNYNSVKHDSFYEYLLDYPQYTRPRKVRGLKVPEVLLSGNHEKIRLWRRKQALKKTLLRRPDMLDKVKLSEEDIKILKEIRTEDNITKDEI
jgi:tRNA (guanine37-N1)-methyltransferase